LVAQKQENSIPIMVVKLLRRVRERTVNFLQTIPRWFWLGGGLIFVLALVFWGGNALLTSLKSVKTMQPTTIKSVAELATNTLRPVTTTSTLSVAEITPPTDTAQPTTISATLLPSETQLPSPTDTFTPGPTPEGFPTLIMDSFGVPMSLVPAGPFEMGSEEGSDNEKPVHTVILNDFYIDQFEITNARYAECVEAGDCNAPTYTGSATRENYYKNTNFSNYPVISVDWYDAQAYCKWRGARLPTEAEWEKAARGGLEGKLYTWGNESPNCSLANFNYSEYCIGDPNIVGKYAPNDYGLYDMAGNVWEWVADWYDPDYFENSPISNPLGSENGSSRILRGGAWNRISNLLRVAYRYNTNPDLAHVSFGIRCARDIAP